MKFKINGLTWELSNVPAHDEALKLSNGNVCLGVTVYHDLRIYLDNTVSRQLYRQTLIHELIHAFAFSFGVHLFANDDSGEESVCDFMGAHFDEIAAIADKVFNSTWKGG